MPRGDKSKYSDKQKRQAEHIEESYRRVAYLKRKRGRTAWATVNKETGGGNKSGSGRGVPDTTFPARRGADSVEQRLRLAHRRSDPPQPRRRPRPGSERRRRHETDMEDKSVSQFI